MREISGSITHASLIGRLRACPHDAAAWVEFVSQYAPRIQEWCRRWGLQHADTQDVTQIVLLKLASKFRDFEYDPSRSFRAWLKTVTHHAWKDYLAHHGRPGRGSGDSEVLLLLDQVEAGVALIECLEEAFDQEILKEAMARVQLRVERRTWEAFRLLAFEDWSGADAARHLDMKVATVFVARSKVQRMLREEVARLGG